MEEINQLIQIRRDKLDRLAEIGVNPYPYEFQTTNFSKDIIEQFDEHEEKSVAVAGRMMSIRGMGKAAFFHMQDQKGKIQIYIRKDKISHSSSL